MSWKQRVKDALNLGQSPLVEAVRCASRGCLNDARRGKYCPKCYSRMWRVNNPVGSAYSRLKDHARERGIHFALTRDYWVWWCNDTGYIDKRGVDGDAMTVDRIRDEVGYVDGNIQMLTKRNNSKKPRTRAKYVKQPNDPF